MAASAMEAKRPKILEAAFRLFHQHGYRKVTMSDIAEAAEMSRPTLYAVFPNKEAVFAAIAEQHCADSERETEQQLAQASTLEAKLSSIVTIWIIRPFSSVIESPSGLDFIANVASDQPSALDAVYERLEAHVYRALKSELAGKRAAVSARDLARIVRLAVRGLNDSATSLAELRRLCNGLVAMAVATAKSA